MILIYSIYSIIPTNLFGRIILCKIQCGEICQIYIAYHDINENMLRERKESAMLSFENALLV